jgi:ankyrin repeat protein
LKQKDIISAKREFSVNRSKIRAADVVNDVRAQMSDDELQSKYQLTPEALRIILRSSVEAGLMGVMELWERTSISESSVMRAFGEAKEEVIRCRDCGRLLPDEDHACHHCAALAKHLSNVLIMGPDLDENQSSARLVNESGPRAAGSGNSKNGTSLCGGASLDPAKRIGTEDEFWPEDPVVGPAPTSCVEVSQQTTDRDIRENLRRKALLKAAGNCDAERVRRLLNLGVDANSKSKSGNTALMLAAYKGNLEVAELLLERGADLNICNFQGNSALFFACLAGRESVTEWLLVHEADPNIRNVDGNTPLMVLCLEDSTNAVLSLLRRGALVNWGNNNGDTPLMKASEKGCPGVALALLDAGAIIDSKNKHGNTALMKAALNGHTEVVRLLLQKGADANARNSYSNTALMKACHRGCLPVARLLLEFGADVSAVDDEGKTAMMRAENTGRAELIYLLARHLKEDPPNRCPN